MADRNVDSAELAERPPMFKLARIAAASMAASLLFVPACGSSPETIAERVEEVGNWMDNPGDIRDALAGVGVSKIVGNEAAARTRAEANGRAVLAATAKAKVQQLIENWYKETGDMLDEKSMSSYMNDEGIVRQFTDLELIGARPMKYAKREGSQYVLMIIDDPAKWTKQVAASVKDRAIKDETLFKTEVMKRDFAEKLDKLVERDSDAASKARDKFQSNYVK